LIIILFIIFISKFNLVKYHKSVYIPNNTSRFEFY